MRRADLAKRLVEAANNRERRLLLSQNSNLADVRLASEIRKACYSVWTSDPLKTKGAESAMRCLADLNGRGEIRATTQWVSGIVAITKGQFEDAVAELRGAGELFAGLGSITDSAETRVAELMALAMLGRYDEAVETGQNALAIFDSQNDGLAAGKILMNLSNVVARRDQHAEAERYALAARKRFSQAGERKWQTMAENDLANTYAELNDFDRARQFYALALDGARAQLVIDLLHGLKETFPTGITDVGVAGSPKSIGR
jgi:tetratricopeptide (TPR) repeat protein